MSQIETLSMSNAEENFSIIVLLFFTINQKEILINIGRFYTISFLAVLK